MPHPRIAATILALTSAALIAQPPTPASSPNAQPGAVPTIRTIARLVVFDVVVTDGQGHPVKNLKASDFTVYEDNKPQRLLSVTEHDALAEAPPADSFVTASGPLPPNTFAPRLPPPPQLPKTVIVLDQLAFPDAPVFRDNLRAFFSSLPPNTPVAIFRIDWQGLHLVQDFTSSASALLDVVNSQRILPPGPFRTRYFRATLPPVIELAHLLAPIPGRINLIWIGSSMIPNTDPSPDTLFGEEVLGSDSAYVDRIVGQSSGDLGRDIAAAIHDLEGNASVLRLSRIALYPIDARGLVGNSPSADLLSDQPGGVFSGLGAGALVSNCQGLREAGINTGGKGFCGTNDLKGALAEAATSGSHYYTVAYTPHNPKWNGAFRQIRVDLGDALHESVSDKVADWVNLTPRVVYRNGYYARDPQLRPANIPPVSPTASATPQDAPATLNQTPQKDQRKLISYSPKGNPQLLGSTHLTPMRLAMTFSLGGPFDLPFHLRVEPSPETRIIPPGAEPPPGNFLGIPWRDTPYRNLTLHYSLDPQSFSFSPSDSQWQDQFELVAILFRDDGVEVNSAVLNVPIKVTPEERDRITDSGIAAEQDMAVPVTGNFILRVGVHEINSGHIGTLSIPTESILVSPTR